MNFPTDSIYNQKEKMKIVHRSKAQLLSVTLQVWTNVTFALK
jgi:hypothetical protein